MKKVVLIGNHDIVIYNFRKEIIERLLVKNFEVYLILPHGDKVDLLIEMGCKFYNLPIDRRGTNIMADFILLKNYIMILRKIKPDVVLTYTIKPNIYGGIACRINRIPYIANITGLGSAVENKGILQKVTTMLYKVAFKNINCVFFQNEENRKFFIDRGIAVGKDRLIPGSGVNLQDFKIMKYPTDKTIHFLYIGRVMKEKGIEQYLETAEYIRSEYHNTEFHILGFCEETYEKKLKELQDKGIVKYHGLQDDIKPFVKISHCTIHPSYYPEGISNVLLESSASGRPIITTNRSGCKETVEDNKTGFIFEKKNSKDLIDKVKQFIQLSHEEKEQMGLAAREKMEKEYDREIVINAYLKEIGKLK